MLQSRPDKCILTDAALINFQPGPNSYSYRSIYGGKDMTLTICNNCSKQTHEETKGMKHILQGLILNDNLPGIENGTIHWEPNGQIDKYPIYLKSLLDTAKFPKSGKERNDNLLAYLYKEHETDYFSKEKLDTRPFLVPRLFFKSPSEFNVHFRELEPPLRNVDTFMI